VPTSASPKVSIIVTTYDYSRLADVEELVDSISNQDTRNFEAIFIIEHSRRLEGAIREMSGKTVTWDLRAIFNDRRPGISSSRNLGIEAARGDIIAFVDDDALLPPHWSRTVEELFELPRVAAVTGPALPLWKDESSSWLPPSFHWLASCTSWFRSEQRCETRSVWGMNMAFSRRVFAKGIHFPENIGGIRGRRLHGEEAVLCFAIHRVLQERIVFEPKLYVHHKVYPFRRNARFIAKSAYYMGSSRRLQKRLYGSYAAIGIDFHLVHDMIAQGIVEALPEVVTHPRLGARKLFTTLLVLLSAGLGYALYKEKSSPYAAVFSSELN
jgi:glucosyl-dolichyl phosphate glucuronosyltransferase